MSKMEEKLWKYERRQKEKERKQETTLKLLKEKIRMIPQDEIPLMLQILLNDLQRSNNKKGYEMVQSVVDFAWGPKRPSKAAIEAFLEVANTILVTTKKPFKSGTHVAYLEGR